MMKANEYICEAMKRDERLTILSGILRSAGIGERDVRRETVIKKKAHNPLRKK